MTNQIFATAINCIDGRVQIPVIEWLRKQYGVDYVDMITAPGPERLLTEAKNTTACALIRKHLEISINRHNTKLVAVAGHHGCAANPASKETQTEQIRMGVKSVEAWKLDVTVIGLWVDKNWEVCEVNAGNNRQK